MAVCVVAAMALPAYWVLRIAWADRLSRANDPVSAVRAVQLAPGNVDFRLRLAHLTEASGGDATPSLQAAAVLDPDNATVWVRLGLAAEEHGDFESAQRDLLQAARVSRQFEPRWTLANYYCRRADPSHFWPWANEALQVAYGDLNPLFQLCWRMSQDPALILARAIPHRRAILGAYLSFLLKDGQMAAAEPVALQLGDLATAADTPVLMAWCDRKLDAGSVPGPLKLWNKLCANRLLPYSQLDPATGASLTDGAFREEPAGGGFGWRVGSPAGVVHGRNLSPPDVSFSFDGNQPESCGLLTQFLPLAPGARYRLHFQYRISEIPAESGLRWSVIDAASGSELAAGSPWLSSAEWKDGEARFTASGSTGLAKLALTYNRVRGTTRIEGTLFLRRMSLEMAP